ncbi:hypothetical protein [Arthrobacter koreensis]|uniref:hypothetical protein n=1 Tax=Arthrobacter koreensis TaxID=199136 RepID=UPI003806874C
MARKTKAQKDLEALQAENALNTNRDGILIRPGQMWRDLNPRAEGRLLSVESVQAGTATVIDGKRKTAVSVERMYPHARGFKIFGSP